MLFRSRNLKNIAMSVENKPDAPAGAPRTHPSVFSAQMTAKERIQAAERNDLLTREFWNGAFRHLPYLLRGFQDRRLKLHPEARVWIARDAYYQRRLVEIFAANVIKAFYRFTKIQRVVKVSGIFWNKKRVFKHMVYFRHRGVKVRRFTLVRSARIISTAIYKFYDERVRFCIRIQRNYRRYRVRVRVAANVNRIRCAKIIQRYVRGMLYRLSDRNILSKIFMKLPEFWREVVSSAPDVVYRCGIEEQQIAEMKAETSGLVTHVVKDVMKGTMPPLLDKLIIQPFDKTPYVSLSDGGKLAFYSDKKSIVADSEVSTAHPFTMKFWPIVRPPQSQDTSTEIHDPNLDGLHPRNKPALIVCSVCGQRMLTIMCNICLRGYCFYCAFR